MEISQTRGETRTKWERLDGFTVYDDAKLPPRTGYGPVRLLIAPDETYNVEDLLGDSKLHWTGEFGTLTKAKTQAEILASDQVAYTDPLTEGATT